MENTEKKKISKGKVFIIIVVVLILVLIVLRILNTDHSVETKPLPTVSVMYPETGDIAIETSLVGTVEPEDVYYVVPKVAGEILNIYVKAGDRVSEGDPICDIDNEKTIDSARISVQSCEVQLRNARDSYELAATNLTRMQALYATGDISKQSYESTKNSYDQAKAAVEAAELSLEAAQLTYDTQTEYATVTAPVSGTVESTDMSINAMASQSSQVCVISSDSDNKITFGITDRLLGNVSVGDPITVTKQGVSYDGTITKVETLASSTTGLYSVDASFDGSNGIPKGSKAKVAFISDSSSDTMIVETDCIYYDGGKTYIYTLSYNDTDELEAGASISESNLAGTIHKNEVEIGLSDSDFTEVLSGIDYDSVVVKSWTSQLYEGAQVQVLPEEG